MSSSRTIRLRPDAVWLLAGDEVIAIDGALTTYVSTSGAGTVLWSELAGGSTAETLAARLVDEYGIDGARAAGDVRVFLADLDAQGLLEP